MPGLRVLPVDHSAPPCCPLLVQVSVRILGGLMALGYTIGTIMKRTSTVLTAAHSDKDGSEVTVKFDDIEQLGRFVQIQVPCRQRARCLRLLLLAR